MKKIFIKEYGILQTALLYVWQSLKNGANGSRVTTFIYVFGAALSITFIMVLFYILYIRFAPIYPEYNRNRMLQQSNITILNMDSTIHNISHYSSRAMDSIRKSPYCEHICGIHNYKRHIRKLDNSKTEKTKICCTIGDFFKVFTLEFLYGKPYPEHFEYKIHVTVTQGHVIAKRPIQQAVVSERFAQNYFARSNVVGEKIIEDNDTLRICGVVRNTSNATPTTAADVWRQDYFGSNTPYGGNSILYMTINQNSDREKLYESINHIKQIIQKDTVTLNLPQGLTKTTFSIDSPIPYWKRDFLINNSGSLSRYLTIVIMISLALLFIPAFNLSSLISSRMDERIAEIGIRRSFGATKRQLVSQVLWENLILMLIGGVLGLIISIGIVSYGSNWILYIFDSSTPEAISDITFTPQMLLSYWAWLAVIGVCCIINVISAFIPTLYAMRKSIIEELNSKR